MKILNFETIYCVGRRTKRLIEQKIGPVKHTEKNANALANYLVELYGRFRSEPTFVATFGWMTCRLVLKENNINVREIEAYSTKLEAPKLADSIEGVMFYSPSTIQSFLQKNSPDVYCLLYWRKHRQGSKKIF